MHKRIDETTPKQAFDELRPGFEGATLDFFNDAKLNSITSHGTWEVKERVAMLTQPQKDSLKRKLVSCLENEKEICRIVIFGSFLKSSEPHDIDVAVFQDSGEKYLPLAMKYRKKARAIAHIIPLDIIPLKA